MAAAGAFGVVVLLARRLRWVLWGQVLLANPGGYYTVVLQQRQSLTHNVRLLRFALPHKRMLVSVGYQRLRFPLYSHVLLVLQTLGVSTCQHVYVHAHIGNRVVVRPYTPVSARNQRGTFDLVVKVYKAGSSFNYPNGGLMSQYLDHLMPGDELQIQGPKGRFVYEGRGQFQFRNGRKLPQSFQLGIVAAGSGVTPMLQLLGHIFADPWDQTLVVMLDVNSTVEDIIARDELEGYARRFSKTFSIWHILSELPESGAPVNSMRGPLNKDIMATLLPAPHPSTVVLCCGPPSLMSNVCSPALRDIGHKDEQVLFF
ncbi:NADH-cytochrome b5 reductase 3-like [Haemaphysalis longicornis]